MKKFNKLVAVTSAALLLAGAFAPVANAEQAYDSEGAALDAGKKHLEDNKLTGTVSVVQGKDENGADKWYYTVNLSEAGNVEEEPVAEFDLKQYRSDAIAKINALTKLANEEVEGNELQAKPYYIRLVNSATSKEVVDSAVSSAVAADAAITTPAESSASSSEESKKDESSSKKDETPKDEQKAKTVLEKKIESAQDFVAKNADKFKDIRVNPATGELLIVDAAGKAFTPVFNQKYEITGTNPAKSNHHDNLPEIKADRDKESGLVNYYPTAAQAEAQARQLNAENPDLNHYIVQMADGQYYVASEAKLLTVRDAEREFEESVKYASQEQAKKAGERLKGIYKNLGYEVRANGDGTYSLRLVEEIQKPAEKNTKFFNSVNDAERHAEKQVGADQYYVVQKTVDGKYIVRYYPKTGIRPYEEREIAGKRFETKEAAESYAKSLARRYLDAEYTVEVEPKTGEYMVVFKAAKETGSALKGENAEQKAGEKSPAATDTTGKKAAAGQASDKAKLPETGEAKGFAAFGAAALALLAGLGLVAPRFKKED